ncbi:MAG TPA: Crp/Fnr family transcriptional regulator [Candidatus Baltobacteraceae bacterium]|nr:Crp/Fnr family transcriptional regulator [Candidatus Baltobacteraceae bacterium]
MVRNLLLAVLPENERRRIWAYCEHIDLEPRATLCEADEPMSHAWFIERGVCSALVHSRDGDAVEVGIIGREGMVGLPLVLGEATNPFHVIVQVPGSAIRIPRDAFVSDALRPQHAFCEALLKYANLYLATVAQTAVCNRLHRIEQRLARWLVEMYDSAQTDVLPMTHELLGLMLGAYRPSITNAIKSLQDRGIVRAGRGRLIVLDAGALENDACECHTVIRNRTASTLRDIRRLAA